MNEKMPIVLCPNCKAALELNKVLTSQSNQNVIYECPHCGYEQRDIQTSKG
jgi:Zn ribbon nucleic-acid-binding protein